MVPLRILVFFVSAWHLLSEFHSHIVCRLLDYFFSELVKHNFNEITKEGDILVYSTDQSTSFKKAQFNI